MNKFNRDNGADQVIKPVYLILTVMSTREATDDRFIDNPMRTGKKPPFKVKPPSYVNISRSINGYTSSLTQYDSKKREGRSRDCSPISVRTVTNDMDEQHFMTKCTMTDTIDYRTESTNSVVVNTIQRLYGSTVKVSPKEKKLNYIPISTVMQGDNVDLPVLKLLNPQFRAKLSVNKYSPPKKTTSMPLTNGNVTEVHGGTYFIQLVNLECDAIKQLILQVESVLPIAPTEHIQARIQAIVGKSNLLMSQKIKQFLGLCEKNISCALDDVSRPKSNDLEGFWDMVKIQVDQVKTEMLKIIELSNKGWPEDVDERKQTPIKSIKVKTKVKKPVVSNSKYETARRKAIEEQRKAMKNLKNDDVIFF